MSPQVTPFSHFHPMQRRVSACLGRMLYGAEILREKNDG